MNKGVDVLERSVIPSGKVFIKAGEENSRAYVIQTGKVISFTEINGRRVDVKEHGPGTIIGELCLMVEAPPSLNYETTMATTVVTITRQDFQKRLTRVDKTVSKILSHAVEKLTEIEKETTEEAIRRSEIDVTAQALVTGLIKQQKLTLEEEEYHERKLLPVINDMIKAIKTFKEEIKNK